MTSLDLVKPWRLIVAMPALLYGTLLLLELPQSWLWLVLVCGVVLMAVTVAGRLEYPMLALWPAFVGLFLVGACVCALIEDVVDYALVPFTDSDSEIVIAILVLQRDLVTILLLLPQEELVWTLFHLRRC